MRKTTRSAALVTACKVRVTVAKCKQRRKYRKPRKYSDAHLREIFLASLFCAVNAAEGVGDDAAMSKASELRHLLADYVYYNKIPLATYQKVAERDAGWEFERDVADEIGEHLGIVAHAVEERCR